MHSPGIRSINRLRKIMRTIYYSIGKTAHCISIQVKMRTLIQKAKQIYTLKCAFSISFRKHNLGFCPPFHPGFALKENLKHKMIDVSGYKFLGFYWYIQK